MPPTVLQVCLWPDFSTNDYKTVCFTKNNIQALVPVFYLDLPQPYFQQLIIDMNPTTAQNLDDASHFLGAKYLHCTASTSSSPHQLMPMLSMSSLCLCPGTPFLWYSTLHTLQRLNLHPQCPTKWWFCPCHTCSCLRGVSDWGWPNPSRHVQIGQPSLPLWKGAPNFFGVNMVPSAFSMVTSIALA